MAVTRSGTSRLRVVSLAVEERSTLFVTATILRQNTAETTAGAWDRIINRKGVTHISVQVKIYESN